MPACASRHTPTDGQKIKAASPQAPLHLCFLPPCFCMALAGVAVGERQLHTLSPQADPAGVTLGLRQASLSAHGGTPPGVIVF